MGAQGPVGALPIQPLRGGLPGHRPRSLAAQVPEDEARIGALTPGPARALDWGLAGAPEPKPAGEASLGLVNSRQAGGRERPPQGPAGSWLGLSEHSHA
ncbi:hypothetical protein NDU88_005918 [Pleurodeles waltl]|uniref:Uncharacterized protein n=1 Tax=Pleurodeles waltl TaxID=8319 RepID=A0AAV7LTE6_PLEWA|nr:hypothetical protein NDU88_005918 [Pleurodeles waltl]